MNKKGRGKERKRKGSRQFVPFLFLFASFPFPLPFLSSFLSPSSSLSFSFSLFSLFSLICPSILFLSSLPHSLTHSHSFSLSLSFSPLPPSYSLFLFFFRAILFLRNFFSSLSSDFRNFFFGSPQSTPDKIATCIFMLPSLSIQIPCLSPPHPFP